MELIFGRIAIKCKRCGLVTLIDNKLFGKSKGHKCPKCGQLMSGREFFTMKRHLYQALLPVYDKMMGPLDSCFEYTIDLSPFQAGGTGK